MIKAMQLRNFLLGKPDSTSLETVMASDATYTDALRLLLCTPAYARDILASSTAMTAVAASSTAMTAVAASSTAMTAVAASSTAKAAIWGDASALKTLQQQLTPQVLAEAMTPLTASSTSDITIKTRRVLILGWYTGSAHIYHYDGTGSSKAYTKTSINNTPGICVSGGAWNYFDTPDLESAVHTQNAAGYGLYAWSESKIYALEVDA